MNRLRVLVLLMLLAPKLTAQEIITTPTILAQTYAALPSCALIRPVGICFWLHCTPWGCRIRTSTKWGNYRPDVVVQSYAQTGQMPWAEMTPVIAALTAPGAAAVGGTLGGGEQVDRGREREGARLLFRVTDAIGHPLGRSALISGVSCPANVTGFRPYFASDLDGVAWRVSELEQLLYPASWIPGLREVGNFPLNTWGSVHPRTGFLLTLEPAKAGAVMAERAGDIITRPGQVPHIYSMLPVGGTDNVNNYRVWNPPPLIENNPSTGWWQMLGPTPVPACEAFGVNDLPALASWSAGRDTPVRMYSWNLWRPYKCCRIRGIWLFSIDWMPFP